MQDITYIYCSICFGALGKIKYLFVCHQIQFKKGKIGSFDISFKMCNLLHTFKISYFGNEYVGMWNAKCEIVFHGTFHDF